MRTTPNIYKWLTMGTVAIGVLATTLDGSIMNLAYPILTDSLNTDPSMVVWVSVSFLLVSASLALPLGTIGDIIGRKRVYISGLMIFTLGLSMAALSQNIGQLITFRIFQGIGQGMMVATMNALLVNAFPDNERGRALGLNGALIGTGLACGPVMGGFVLEYLGWRALFWCRIPVSIIGFLIGLIVLKPDSKIPANKRPAFDYLGTISLMIGLSAFLLLTNRAPIEGPSALVIGLGGTSILSLWWFSTIEKRVKIPIFDLALLRERLFSMTIASSLMHYIALSALLFLTPFYLLEALGIKPSEAGPILMTLPITRLVFSPISGALYDKVQSRTIATLGIVVMAIGYLLIINLDETSSILQIIIALIVAGSGSSTFLPPNNSVIMGSVSRDRLGMVSAVIPVIRQVGLSLGMTIAGTFYALQEISNRSVSNLVNTDSLISAEKAAVSGYNFGISIAIVFVLAAVMCSALRGPETNRI